MYNRIIWGVLILLSISCNAFADSLSLKDIVTNPNEIGYIDIGLTIIGNEKYTAYQMDVELPEGFGLISSNVGSFSYILGDGRYSDTNQQISIAQISNGTYRVLSYSSNNLPLLGKSGVILRLPFSVESRITDGKYSVLIKEVRFTSVGNDGHSKGTSFKDVNASIFVARPVIVTANSYSRLYGDDNPNFAFTTEGATLDGTPIIECDATPDSPVGEYPITIKKGSVKNYNDTYVRGVLTITKAPLEISAQSYTRKQGEANPVFAVSYKGWKNNETESVLTKMPIATCEAEIGSAIGTYDITVNGAEASNYEISYVAGKLTVTKADLVTVTAKNYTRMYGDDNPMFEYEASGATLEGEPLIECEATAASPVGEYTIKISKGGVKNYNDKYVAGTLTITKAPLTITAKSYTRKQGEANPMLEVTYEGLKNGETADVLTRQPTVSCSAKTSSFPGEYEISVEGAQAENYDITFVSGQLTVTDADPVTVTAKSYSRIYGEANPKFAYEVSGAALDGEPVISCEATITSPVGEYEIVVSKGTVKNYNDKYVTGKLTITKAPLIITTKDYYRKQGEANPVFDVSYAGWRNGESKMVLTKQPVVTCEATATSKPGAYDIIVSGAEATNYDIRYVVGKLIVTEANAVIVRAKSYTRKYGDANPVFEYEVSGAKLDGEPDISCEATATSPIGEYDIVASKGTVKNYNDIYVAGKLTITKAPLIITTKNYYRKQGEDNPLFEVSFDGWKNGETETVLTKQPILSCKATADSEPGEYDIIISDADALNYDISYVTGKLIITPPDFVVVTAKSYTRKYGDSNPEFEYEVYGAALDGKPVVSCEATALSPVGEYDIVVAKGTVKNNNDMYIAGKLTVTPAQLSAKVDDASKTYGEDNPQFTTTFIGFVNGDTERVLTNKGTYVTTATKTSDVGRYDVTLTDVEAKNYVIDKVEPGTLTIEQAEQQIVWSQELGDIEQFKQMELTAMATSGLPVSYQVLQGSDVCSVVKIGNTTFLDCFGTGNVTLSAWQEGNKNYYPTLRTYKQMKVVSTGINATSLSDYTLTSHQDVLLIGGLQEGEIVEIRDMAGRCVYLGQEDSVRLTRGCYVVRIGRWMKKVLTK